MDKMWHHCGYLSSRMLSVIEHEFLVMLALGHWFSVAPGRKGLWRRPVRAEEVFDCNSTQQGRIWQAIGPITLFCISLRFFLLSSPPHLALSLLLATGIESLELFWKSIEIWPQSVLLAVGAALLQNEFLCRLIEGYCQAALVSAISQLLESPQLALSKQAWSVIQQLQEYCWFWSWLSHWLFWTERRSSWWKRASWEESGRGSLLFAIKEGLI